MYIHTDFVREYVFSIGVPAICVADCATHLFYKECFRLTIECVFYSLVTQRLKAHIAVEQVTLITVGTSAQNRRIIYESESESYI